MLRLLLGLALGWFCTLAAPAAEVVTEGHYYDEAGMRYFSLEKAEFGSTRVVARQAAEPGYYVPWTGIGQLKGKELTFAQAVGEGENRGTYFIAEVSESKVQVRFRPEQKEPQDPGILGTFRRVSDVKLVQLAKKEHQAALERLTNTMKAAAKTAASMDRPALSAWKAQYPTMQQRWMAISYKAPEAVPATDTKPPLGSAVPSMEKPADYWFKLANVAALGYGFMQTPVDPKTSTDWPGDYQDFAGGSANVILERDGRLRVTLSFLRGAGEIEGSVSVVTPPSSLGKTKEGYLTADFIVKDAEIEDLTKLAHVRLTKIGHYLQVETERAGKYATTGWFDGIYRGSPPAVPQ